MIVRGTVRAEQGERFAERDAAAYLKPRFVRPVHRRPGRRAAERAGGRDEQARPVGHNHGALEGVVAGERERDAGRIMALEPQPAGAAHRAADRECPVGAQALAVRPENQGEGDLRRVPGKGGDVAFQREGVAAQRVRAAGTGQEGDPGEGGARLEVVGDILDSAGAEDQRVARSGRSRGPVCGVAPESVTPAAGTDALSAGRARYCQ